MTASTTIKRTAKETEFRGGLVWIKTLNTVHRGDAEREAHFAVALRLQPLRKGQPVYKAYKLEFDGMPTSDRINFLVQHETNSGRIFAEAYKKFPNPPWPERADEDTDDQYNERVGRYNELLETLTINRAAFIEHYNADLAATLGKTPSGALTDRCLTAHLEAMYNAEFQRCSTIQTIYHAVRRNDERLENFFSSPEEVADLDDEEFAYLQNEYASINTVTQQEIPT